MATIEKRTKKKGDKLITVYRVKVRVKGYPPLNATFERLTDARTWAGALESDMKRGKHIKEAEAKKHTLAELIDRYIKEKLPERKPEYQREFKMQLDWWKSAIGSYLLSDVTSSLLAKCRNDLLKEPNGRAKKTNTARSGATVNRYMAALSIVFTKAVTEWEWLEVNPMLKVDKNKESKGRIRFLTQEEQNALLNACKDSGNDLIYMLVVLALSTGARYGELLNIKWDNVKFHDENKNVTLYLMNTKNGDNRSLTIGSLGYELLKAHSKIRKINTKYVFARPDGKKPYDLRKQWEKALKTAGITDFRFHDLRHTTASNLAMNGASLRDIAEILGHRTLQMVKRYSHLTTQYTTKVLQELNEKQFEQIQKA